MNMATDRLIGLMTSQNLNQLIGLWGIFDSGHGFVPIDPSYPPERINFMIRDCGIETLVTEARHLDKALQLCGADGAIKQIICLDEVPDQHSDHPGVTL